MHHSGKVVLLTDGYGPHVSTGAVGTVTDHWDQDYDVSFSAGRRLVLRADEIRTATPDEIAADLADPDLDERFNS